MPKGNDELENVAKVQEQSQPAMSKIVTADATEVAKEQKSTRLGRVAAAMKAESEQENAKLKENAPETKTEKSDKKSENSNVNASETPTKDSSEVFNISTQQVAGDDVKENNELIHELSTIDTGLDHYADTDMIKIINLNGDSLSNEQKDLLAQFVESVEQNPENKPARVR